MAMAEGQARHRVHMDRLGLVACVTVAVLAIVVPSVLLAVTGQSWPVGLAALAPAAVIATVFARFALRPG